MSRVAIIAPFGARSARGNAVTVERVSRGLLERGVDLRVWDASSQDEATLLREVETFRPGLVHAFHARRTGPLGLRLARRLEAPLVVTLTGTDANHDLFDPVQAPWVRRVLEGASRITAFHASIVERVTTVLPDTLARVVVVPQSVRFEAATPFDVAAHWALPADRLLFALPAGIRAVKAPRAPLAPLGSVAAADPRVRLAYVGPVLEVEEGDALGRALAGRPWARYLGAVPHALMASLLTQADVVLNCSLSEGGMANSVLEALALGRAVLAADIPANRALITHDRTGLLFRDGAELAALATRLARDPALRARLGRAGQARVEHEFPVDRELSGYCEVYRHLAQVVPV